VHRFASAVGLVAVCVLSVLAASTPAQAAYYYCPTGLVDTATSDGLANGRNCAYWLLPTFPSPTAGSPIPGLDVLPVWQRTQGAGVTVALVDTGVDPAQSDYAPNLLPGWNFFENDANTSDDAAHGTLLASIIAAASGNGSYVGIAPQARLLPVKITGGRGGEEWSAAAPAKAIVYAVRHGARVVNCSWGGLNVGAMPGMAHALSVAAKASVLVVLSAGNDGVDLDDTTRYVESPNSEAFGLPNTLTVANFSNSGTLAADSNYGARHVQIASLGDTLWGDYPGSSNGGYVGGTSAAAATVSGVAALLFAAYPNATAAQVRRAIIVGANRSVAALHGKVEAGGLLSAVGALDAMGSPDSTRPSAFRAFGPARFRLARPHTRVFRWSRSSDSELEGYLLTVDGRTTVLTPGSTSVALYLARGPHRWSVRAYDLSGNERVAVVAGR
jgi:hypothetical protein